MPATDIITEPIPDPVPRSFRRAFMRAAEHGNAQKLQQFVEAGFPINYQDEGTLQTALHVCAATQARKALRYLVGTGKVNFLTRDFKGRLASELAYVFGEDPAVSRWLSIHERRQAREQGIVLTRRPLAPMI